MKRLREVILNLFSRLLIPNTLFYPLNFISFKITKEQQSGVAPRLRALARFLVLGGLCLVSSKAWSLNLNALYTAACQREIGVILAVDDVKIKFLTISGQLKDIRPHEIIYLAYYPMDHFPIVVPTANLSKVPKVTIKTQVNLKIQTLVSGWPIGFTKEKVSFLLPSGSETVIKRRSIFAISSSKNKSPVKFRRNNKNYNFVHPYAFKNCPLATHLKKSSNQKPVNVYPQQVLSQPVMIKRELDHLKAGYKLLKRYHKEQNFYPVPEVYKNETSLGLWHSEGSRYGASNKRPNNITPVLTDSYSSDVFDYQHTFITGSAPMPFAIHEEPQTFVYYRFKASYFHFSAMADPNLILVGKNYRWKESDMLAFDDRLNPTGMLEMGFDFGPLTFDLYLSDNLQVGIRSESDFYETSLNLSRVGLSYRNHLWSLTANGGKGEDVDKNGLNSETKNLVQISVFRINMTSYYFKATELMASFIQRNINYQAPDATYESDSSTAALYLKHQGRSRISWGGYFAFEKHNNSYSLNGGSESQEAVFPKGGGFMAISF